MFGRINFNYLPLAETLANLAIARISTADLGGGETGPTGPAGNTGATGISVQSVTVDSGNLIVTLSDTTTIDTGKVLGATGLTGNAGPTGDPGATGISVQSAAVDSGNLIVTLSDASIIDAGPVIGATGITCTIDRGNLISIQMVFS